MKIDRGLFVALLFIGLLAIAVGCAGGPNGERPTPRREVVVGVGAESPTPVYAVSENGTAIKVGNASLGNPLCFRWPFSGPIGKIVAVDMRGARLVVEFEPYSADAWVWDVSASDWPRPLYGEAKCAR